jgi:transposase
MITIGVDAHKREHVAVVLDEAGRELNRWRGPNSAEGWLKMLGWASSLDGVRRWGVEGAWNYGRGLSQHLLGAGEEVYEVNPRWTAEMRKRSRKRGKSDRLDARAVAGLVWREGSDEGKTAREALRALKRYIVRAIWRLWRQCRTVESSTRDDGAAAHFT